MQLSAQIVRCQCAGAEDPLKTLSMAEKRVFLTRLESDQRRQARHIASAKWDFIARRAQKTAEKWEHIENRRFSLAGRYRWRQIARLKVGPVSNRSQCRNLAAVRGSP